jgi:hypothetical protein
MKLGKLIKFIDGCTTIRIFQNISLNGEEWEIVFEGLAMDTPWSLMKYHLIDAKDNDGDEAICPFTNDDDGQVCLRITLGD